MVLMIFLGTRRRPFWAAFLLSFGFARAVSAAPEPFSPPRFPEPTFPAKTYNVHDFGVHGTGLTNETAAINEALERCSAQGGGTVVFPAGHYLAASIHLKNNVRLLLGKDAVITGAPTGFDAPEPNAYDKYQDFGHSHFH